MAMVSVNKYFSARIGCRADMSIITTIMAKLSAHGRMRFKESCFGQFVDMEEMQFQGQLYLHLLFKQDVSKLRNTLVFHINDVEAQFGPTEFSLITGLHFGEKTPIPTESEMFKKVFKNKSVVNVQDIESAFLKAVDNEENDLSFKLALLWVLYGILLIRGHSSRKIDAQYIHLANDVGAFNGYPWGSIAYEFLISEFRSSIEYKLSAQKGKAKGKESESRCQIDVHGFGLALQIWAYESMPSVAKLCAIQKSSTLIPRMLRWKSNGIVKFDELTKECFPNGPSKNMNVKETLMPSKAEMKTPFYASVVNWVKVHCIPSSQKQKTKRKRNTEGSCSKDIEEEEKKGMKAKMDDDEAAWRTYVKIHLESINENQVKLEKLLVGVMKRLDKEGVHEDDEGVHEDEEGVNAESSMEVAKSDEGIPSKEGDDVSALMLFDEKLATFEAWMEDNRESIVTIPLGVKVVPSVTASWFDNIWNPEGWLEGEHIDALMHLIMFQVRGLMQSSDERRRSTFVDLNFWVQVTSGVYETWQQSVKEGRSWDWSVDAKAVHGHVIGRLPINDFGIPWSAADYVYGIANILDNHWVLYEIRFLEQTIMIYDSQSGGRPPARQKFPFIKLASVLQCVCEEMDLLGDRCTAGNKKDVWSVEFCSYTPKQTNSSDCGIMCIKMFECLMFGMSVRDIIPHMCGNFRHNYCAQLFHFGK